MEHRFGMQHLVAIQALQIFYRVSYMVFALNWVLLKVMYFNYDGLAISGATVAVATGATATSGPDGYYTIWPVNAGNTEVSCGKAGYNTTTDVVTVLVGRNCYP